MKWFWNGSKLIRIFILGVLLYLLAVLPFIVYRGGIFFYYGDYNVQQVPFYILAHRAVRNGNFFWNFNLDLGSSMGGSFAFYLWGSPYFWFSCLFPEAWIPYMMPFFMSLKYGTALLTAFLWLRSQVRSERGALFGALLYAFSGFAACNIVFQHFHEAIAFFPLYLLAVDSLHGHLQSARTLGKTAALLPGFLAFSLMTAAMSVINYFFFFGQVVFLILYWLIRYLPRQRIASSLREIGWYLLAGLLGLGLAAFFLIQVWDTVSGNTRLSDILLGYDMLAYSEPATPLAILKSFFMLPDLVGRGTLFTSEQVRVSSLSMYVPCFAVSGAIAFLRSKKRGWTRRLLLACLVTAFVPILNSVFAMFNSEYYARWFYMPILMICLVTAEELEESDRSNLRIGVLWTLLATALLILCAFLPTRNISEDAENGIAWLQIMEYPELFLTEAVVTALMLPALICIVRGIHVPSPAAIAARVLPGRASASPEALSENPSGKHRSFLLPRLNPQRSGMISRTALVLTALCCLLTQMGVLYNGNSLIAKSGGTKWRSQLLSGRPGLPGYEDTDFSRIETDGTSTNYEMVWGYPTIHCFESTVSPGIFAFYKGIGKERTVDSKLSFQHIGARAILSARYYLENDLVSSDESYSEKGGLMGYRKTGESGGYSIYENQYFIPMGFTFDRCITEDTYSLLLDEDETAADRLLAEDIILNGEDADRYGYLFEAQDTSLDVSDISSDRFFTTCKERAATACSSFRIDRSGFTASTTLERENLVFFSVPYERGWKAAVDGQEADVVTADYGLMAVYVPAGTHTITFTYLPYGFVPAAAVSCCAGAILLVLLLCAARGKVHAS